MELPLDSRTGLSLAARVYAAIRQSLSEGEYQSGDRLVESEIAERLQVSRTPVREALGRLEAERLLESVGSRGLFVRRLDVRDVMDLYAMREIIEGAAARMAAEHAQPADLEAMGDLVEAFADQTESARESMRIDRLFHNALRRASGNRYLEPMLDDMLDLIATLGMPLFIVEQRRLDAAAEHRAIVEAIAARDGVRAEELARSHVRKALRVRLRLLQKT